MVQSVEIFRNISGLILGFCQDASVRDGKPEKHIQKVFSTLIERFSSVWLDFVVFWLVFWFVEVGWFVFLLGGMEAYSSLFDMLSMLHEAEALGRGNQALSGSALEKSGLVIDLIGGWL